MLMLDAIATSAATDSMAIERVALVKALDMGSLWQSCSALISKALPCHSCSLLFDIEGYQPQQGRHHLAETRDDGARLVTSLDVAAPYLDAHPRVPWYTFSQIASQDAQATERLHAQNPTPGWDEFIHMAFWDQDRLDAVLKGAEGFLGSASGEEGRSTFGEIREAAVSIREAGRAFRTMSENLDKRTASITTHFRALV